MDLYALPNTAPTSDLMVDSAWDNPFNDMRYTAFCMIDYLNDADLDYGVYLREPDILQRYSTCFLLGPASDLRQLIALPGRCTYFELHVIGLLELWSGYESDYDFQFYDFGTHRTAWCTKTKRLVGSSSLLGSPYLNEGAWLNADTQRQWKAKNGLSKLKSVNGSVRQAVYQTI
jgi:hypothetical protein